MLELVNKAVIEGILVKKDIGRGTNAKGEYIRATLTIRTSDTQDVEVKMYSAKLTKEGKENSNYKGIETIEAEYKTIEQDKVGDAVGVYSGELTMNRYKGKDGLLKEGFEIKTNFCSRIKESDMDKFNPRAEFDLTCFVKSGVNVMNAEGEFDHYKMTTVVPMYGDAHVEEFDLLVRDEMGAEFMAGNFAHGSVGVFNGDIIKQVEIIELASTVSQGWGRESKSTKTIRRTELLIRGCSEVADAYDPKLSVENVKLGLENLEKKRVEIMSKVDTPSATGSTGVQATRTFGTGQVNSGFGTGIPGASPGAPTPPVAPQGTPGQVNTGFTPAPPTPGVELGKPGQANQGFNTDDIPF